MATKLPLEQAIHRYLNHCEAVGLSRGTLRAYGSALDKLRDTVGNINACNLTQAHLDKVFLEAHWTASTRNSRLSQYKSFFAWCRASGLMGRDYDPAFGWRKLKVAKPEQPRIPHAEWGRLFDAVRHPQERIVLATGLYLFLRSSEQKAIQIKHIHLAEQEIEVFRVKTQDWDVMPISEELDGHLRAHLTWMSQTHELNPDDYLIPARSFKTMARSNGSQFVEGTGTIDPSRPIYAPFEVVKRILGRAGYPTYKQGEHTLRRSGARAYFDALATSGYDGALRRVQSMLGHSKSATTEIYLGLDLDRRQRNADLKGKPMFAVDFTNVVKMREVSGG